MSGTSVTRKQFGFRIRIPSQGREEVQEEIISQIKMNVLMGHPIAREGVIARVVRFAKVLVNVKFVILIHVNVFVI